MGLVWSSVINSIIGLIINTHYSGKFLNYPTIRQFRDLLPTILVVFATVGIVFSFLRIFELSNILQISFSFVLGLLTTIALSEIIKLAPYIYMKHLILDQIKK